MHALAIPVLAISCSKLASFPSVTRNTLLRLTVLSHVLNKTGSLFLWNFTVVLRLNSMSSPLSSALLRFLAGRLRHSTSGSVALHLTRLFCRGLLVCWIITWGCFLLLFLSMPTFLSLFLSACNLFTCVSKASHLPNEWWESVLLDTEWIATTLLPVVSWTPLMYRIITYSTAPITPRRAQKEATLVK